jgi:type I restriction enzyme, R subunit
MSDRGDAGPLTAEQRARVLIDRQLSTAGWIVQNRPELNLFAAQGAAVREVIMAPGHGRGDYVLYVDRRVVGVIEAKPKGTTLSGVEWQSARYAAGLPAEVRLMALTLDDRLPFVFKASGSETHLTNGYDPAPRARSLFAFPRPETLARTFRKRRSPPRTPPGGRVRSLPPVITEGLRPVRLRRQTGQLRLAKLSQRTTWLVSTIQ